MEENKITVEVHAPHRTLDKCLFLVVKVVGALDPRVGERYTEDELTALINGGATVIQTGVWGAPKRKQ